jgi:hypothetical protein
MERNSLGISPVPFAVAAVVGASLHSGIVANAVTAGQAEPSRKQIGDLAQRIWEAEGRPEGRADEHWMEAEARLRTLFGHIRMVREGAAW